MNPTSKTTLQALGYGLAGAAAAAIANETARRVNPRPSPLAQLAQLAQINFLGRRRRFNNPFGKGSMASNLFSNPLFYNFGRERSVKRNLLRSALLGIGAGLGSLALPKQKRGIWRARGTSGSGLKTIGRLVAGGLVAAAASRLINRTLRDRHHHDQPAHEQHLHEQPTHEQFG